MPSKRHCPRCKSEDIITYKDHIECTQCGSTFSIETIESEIHEDNMLAEEELDIFTDGFHELKDEKTRKKFLKSLDEDLNL